MPPYPDIPQYTNAASPEEAQEWKAFYEQQLQEHANANGLADQIKTQMLKAIPETAYKRLKDHQHNYAYVTPAQLLAHLVTTYGIIEPEDLDANSSSASPPHGTRTP